MSLAVVHSSAQSQTQSKKDDKKPRKKATAGIITVAEHVDLKANFDHVILFFQRYAAYHDLSDKFILVIQEFGPIPSNDLDDRMRQFEYSQTQFLQLFKYRKQTLKIIEGICMERFGVALRNFYQVRVSHDMVLAIDAQQKHKIESLKKHSSYTNYAADHQDTSDVHFTLAPSDGEHESRQVTLEQMTKMTKDRMSDRESRLAMESLALRGLRQLLKINTRNEEQAKNWKSSRPPSPH
jgi:hypothetical protein